MTPTNLNRPEERLIGELAAGLTPVRRTGPTLVRAGVWLTIAAAMAAGLAYIYGTGEIASRLAMPDMTLALIGSALTAILAVVAAFQLGLPDRSPAWALLPAPALLLWIGASGAGCLRTVLAPETSAATLSDTGECLTFILAFSLPLSAVLILMLRRAYPLRPSLTFGIAGLAAAGAAATLLNFCHPFDASLLDLGVHAATVAVVIVANQALGRFSEHRKFSAEAA